jgi:hypothetical protein
MVLLGFGGLAVDLGYIQYQERQQQSAADAAAIAGAQQLIYANTCPDQSAAQTAAANGAKANGFTNGSGSVTVTAVNPPASGPLSSDNCAVEVDVYSPHPTWFSKLFGMSGNVTTSATAVIESVNSGPGGPCLIALDNGGSGNAFTASGITVNSPSCGVQVNGNVTTSGSTLKTEFFGYSGSLVESGSDFNPAAAQMLPVVNPCPDITGCNYLSQAGNEPTPPPSASACPSYTLAGQSNVQIPYGTGCYSQITISGSSNITMAAGTYNVGSLTASGSSITLQPGTYGNGSAAITASGIPVTLTPGLYNFDGGVDLSGSTVNGNGVTIYQTSGAFTVSGSSGTLSACTASCSSGAVSGVLYYQPPSNTSGSAFSGSGSTYNGLVYAPNAALTASGSGTGYVIYIASTFTVSGSNFANTPPAAGPNPGPTPSGLFIKNAVLAL